MDQGAITETAEGFVRARKNDSPLAEYPGQRPSSLTQAYAVQDAALSIWNKPIGGWKVGKINPPLDAVLGANRLSGPIFTDTIFEAAETPPHMPVFTGGFAAAEAEFMLRLELPSDPSSLPETDEATVDWISDIRIGIEVASSPYSRINEEGPLVTISDHGNNFGLVLGPQVPREKWRELDTIEVAVHIAGEEVGRATTATMLDGPLGAVRFLLRNLIQRGITLQAGWWISTGAVTGVHPIAAGQAAHAEFAGVGPVDCIICVVP
jgi:2-keto-4-pentenoate hydratase